MSGPAGTLVVLVPSLGTTARVWERPAAALRAARPDLQVVPFELPGHGEALPATGFDVNDVAAALLEAIAPRRGGRPCVVAGVSMGGAVALEAANTDPESVAGVGMFDSAARFGTAADWAALIRRVADSGLASLREASAEGWFTAGFRREHPDLVRGFLDDLEAVDPDSYLACCEALARYDGKAALAALRAPLLAVAGSDDAGPTPEAVRDMADTVSGARFEVLEPAAHLSVVEHPETAAALLIDLVNRAEGLSP